MKQKNISLAMLMAGILVFGIAPIALALDHELVGAPKCKMCHGAKTGNQWKIWTASTHALAYETLATEKAKEIAAGKGLGDPQKEAECLKCHVTRPFLGCEVTISAKGKYDPSEGVGCEACHGPGSAYKKVMKDHEAAVKAGLATELSEELCKKCHNEASPTFKGFDYAEQWKAIAHPLQKLKK